MLKDPPNDSQTHSDATFSPSPESRLLRDGKPEGPIVIPVDFSMDSIEAVKQGYNLCIAEKQPIHLLHVIPDHKEANAKRKKKGSTKKRRQQRDRAADRMAWFLRKNDIPAALKKAGIKYFTTLARGEPLAAILATAEKIDAGLIIMGCGRNSGPSANLLGSTTERVLRLTQRPIMVVKHPLLDKDNNQEQGD